MKIATTSRAWVLSAGLASAAFGQSERISISGRITSGSDQGIAGCDVTLKNPAPLSTKSDMQGGFSLRREPPLGLSRLPAGAEALRLNRGRLEIRVGDASQRVVVSLNGTLRTLDWNSSSRSAPAGMGMAPPLGKASAAAPESLSVEIQCAGFENRVIPLAGYTQDLGVLILKPIDQCPADPAKVQPGRCGCGVPEDACGGIKRIGTTTKWDANGEDINIAVPAGTRAGDLMLLALHRTDDFLPLKVKGWTRAAECYKTDNGFQCAQASTCKVWVGGQDGFCQEFNTGIGRDLAQAIYYKEAAPDEPASHTFDLNFDGGGHPGWILLTTFRGAMTVDPIRAWAGVGNDGSDNSRFPSVEGQPGDMLVLSQSFDDFVSRDRFTAPIGMEDWGYVGNSDETGFLFGSPVTASGPTGARTTRGPGSYGDKDALLSLTLKPRLPR